MRCAWCSAEATVYTEAAYIPRCCDAEPCLAASSDVNHALWDWRDQFYGRARPAGPRALKALKALKAAEDAAEERDARELRGEAIDWTRPVDGWALFDAVTP